MKKFVSFMLIAIFAMTLCVAAFAAPSQQETSDGKITYSTEAVSAAEAKQIKNGYKFKVNGYQCYSFNGVNYVEVGGELFEAIDGVSIYNADSTSTSGKGGTSLKTGTALVAVLALTACCAGGVAVVTGKKA